MIITMTKKWNDLVVVHNDVVMYHLLVVSADSLYHQGNTIADVAHPAAVENMAERWCHIAPLKLPQPLQEDWPLFETPCRILRL
jgi:hypothetical protein